ncbi:MULTISPECIES: hypothetical protein [Empedobacter]|uniref:hypothetical protein n=1 Tax=Empedobacter TaxID=59734 RepID=UPI0025790034|nr:MULTISPECIES: hypothetical protein [Empedobacter]MDM1042120.1 hypothetical protein [Empedobacter brevis]MDM1136005.1 hypothetical protein [Empedobacter sp. R750]
MALDNNTQITDRNTINNWFKTGLKPNQQQFWSTWASFWHKSDTLPIGSIKGLGDLIDGKAEENHTHDIYATNDATSLNSENVTAWKKKLGVADLKFDDKAITITQDYADFGLQTGATINAFNNAIYSEVAKKLDVPTENATNEYVILGDGSTTPKGDLGKNFANTDLVVTTNRKHTGTASVEFGFPFNCSNPSIRYSGILDKSTDATFNDLLGVDSNGNTAKVGLNAVTNAMSKSTDAQKEAFRLASRKTGETYSTGQPRIDFINPPIIDKTKPYVQYVSLIGLNLFLPNGSYINVYKKSDDSFYKTIIDFQVNQSQTGIVTFGEDFSEWLTGEYYFTIYNSLSNTVSIPNKNKILILSENVENLPIPNLEFESNNSSLIFTGNSTNIIGTVFNAKSITPIITSQDVLDGVGVEISFNYSGKSWGRFPSRIALGLVLPDKTINDTIIDLGVISNTNAVLMSVPENINSGEAIVGNPTNTVRNFKVFIAMKNGVATIFCTESKHISTVLFSYVSDMYFKFALVDPSTGNDGGSLGLSGITRKIRL